MPPPIGAELTVRQLIAALRWKIDNRLDERELQQITKGWERFSQDKYLRQELSWQLNNVDQILRILSSRGNSLQSANKLPAEILSLIFSLVQGNTSDEFPPPPPEEMVKMHSWMSVTRVCQYWRQCALQTAHLWRRLVLGNDVKCPASLGLAYLERSDPCLFELTLDATSLYFKDSEATLQIQHLYHGIRKARRRIGALHLFVGSQSDEMLQLLNLNLPTLFSLQVIFVGLNPMENGNGDDIRDNFMELTLPSLYNGSHNGLQRLTLSMAGTWKVPLIPLDRLTHLTIEAQRCNELEIHSLLGFLLFCPRLECLNINLYLIQPFDEEDIPVPIRTLELPFLRKFELLDHFGLPSYLLRHITIPEDTELVLRVKEQIFDMSYFRESHKMRLPPAKYLEKITTLAIQNLPKGTLELRGNTLTVSASFPYEFDAAPQISFPWPLAHVKTIFIDMAQSWFIGDPRYFFASLFRLYDKAKVVEVKGSRKNIRAFLGWLDGIDSDDTDRVRYVSDKDFQGHILLPSLSSVVVHVDETLSSHDIEYIGFSKQTRPIPIAEFEEFGLDNVIQMKQRPALWTSYTLEVRRV